MLVLRRKANQRILIGDDVQIEVLEIADGQVLLGFEAPKEVPILRQEVGRRSARNEESGRGC